MSKGSCDLDSPEIINAAYDNIAVAAAAYEDSTEVNQFSSKYDAYAEGKAIFTEIEEEGRKLFKGDYTEKEALAADCWPEPEVEQNVNEDELGNLGLEPGEEKALVEFLKTLSDGYQP